MRLHHFAAAMLVALGLAKIVTAVSSDPRELFRWDVVAEKTEPHGVGDTVWIVATVTIAPGHYLYAERTSVSVQPVAGVRVGEAHATQPHLAYDEFEGREVTKYYDEAVFRIPLVAEDTLRAGALPVTVTLRHQGCSKTMCYFPASEERTVAPTFPSGSGGIAGAGSLADYSEAGRGIGSRVIGGLDVGDVIARSGWFLALGIMFVGGVLTSFTPCVYPLIPITVGLLGAARASTARGFLLSATFVLGMAAMYSVLGVAAAATGAVFGSVMSNPVVVGAVALVFLFFAASMFGAFEMQLPAPWQTRLSRVGGVGVGGAFGAGLVAGVIAAPCTGPVLGAALTYVATTGELSFGFAAMFSFAVGMGLLFIVIGTFSARVVPKSGPWLEKVKSVFGIVMVVVALYFLKDAVPPLKSLMHRSSPALVLSLALVAAGILVGAVHLRFVPGVDRQGNREPTPSVLERARKTAGILAVVAGLFGLLGYLVAPRTGPTGPNSASPSQPNWITDEGEGLARARREGKPVLIDAYADWCVACKELDHLTYGDPNVLDRLKDFVAIKLDLTNPTAKDQELIRRYGVVGLPTVIILDRHGQELRDRRILGFLPPEEFLRRTAGVQ